MRLPGELLGALEIALNKVLADDAEARAECARLAGRSLALHLREFNLELFVLPHTAGVTVAEELAGAPDVRLSGGLRDFARHLFGDDEALGGGVRIEGDALLAQAFARMLRRADFDVEDWLAQRVGDVPAELLGRFGRGALAFARRAADTLSLDSAEYLREESRDVIGRAEADEWIAEVDKLRAAADRLGARLRRLVARKV